MSSEKGRRFSHLRWKDRLKIERMLKEGHKVKEIAAALHVDTVAEIAQRYNMSESKVKTRLHRIREKLRVYLMQEGIAV